MRGFSCCCWVHRGNIEPPVVVVVEEGNAAPHRFQDVVLCIHTSVNNARTQPSFPRHIDKAGIKRQAGRFASGKRLNASRCHSAILISLQAGTERGKKDEG
jgi:hypothetical protein